MIFRLAGEPSRFVEGLRNAIEPGGQRGRILIDVRSLELDVDATAAPQRFRTLLMGFFSGLALLLAAIGLYGVMSYAVSQRTREIGIRMALGAAPGRVLRMVIGQGFRLVGLGILIGLAGAVVGGRFLTSLLLNVPSHDPATLAVVSLVLLSVSLLACCVPARRAVSIEPMEALRHD
jgi:putative ABC transport system permease protein